MSTVLTLLHTHILGQQPWQMQPWQMLKVLEGLRKTANINAVCSDDSL